MGGHAGGDIASALCTQKVALADSIYSDAEDATKQLRKTIWQANTLLGDTVKDHPELAGMGTTFSGMVLTGDEATVLHIGDSRVYLARDGVVKQITNDHTFVQRLVETGRITPEEALVHPRRNVLMRVLGDVEAFPEIDATTMVTRPGDRWMLCSDGLSGVVPPELTAGILLSKITADEASELLVGEALEHGAPDNVTVVVVDVVDAALPIDFVPTAQFVGSGANEVVIEERKGNRVVRVLNSIKLSELLRRPEDPTGYVPESEEYLEKILRETKRRILWRKIRQTLTILLLVAFVIFGLFKAYEYTQGRFYVGIQDNRVTVFKGIKESLGPLTFSDVYLVTDITVDDLNEYQLQLLQNTITATDLQDARRILNKLKEGVANNVEGEVTE
jgi:protein phosphatase